MDKSLVVRLRTPPASGGPPFRFGSGYLIGPGRVLTAGHVLRPHGDDAHVPATGDRCQVLPWGGDPDQGWLPGQVEHCDVGLDLAVVSVPGMGGGAEQARWARLEGSEPVRWKAIGFPVAGLDDSGRQPETVWGEVSPATDEFVGKLGLRVDSRTPRPTPGGTSGWAGLSGAAVFSRDRLVGVVIEDPPKFNGSLTARRIDHLGDHALLYEAAGSPVIEAISADSADDSEWIFGHAEAMKREFLTRLGGEQAVSTGVAEQRYIDVLVRPRPAIAKDAVAAESRAVPLAGYLGPPGGRLVLLGGGGTGKTIILLKTAIDLCDRASAAREAPAAIFARLNFFDARANGFGELMNLMARSAQLERVDAEAIWAQRRRPCVFLLDGFNEVNPSAREACALALRELLQHDWHSYVITSRPGSDSDELAQRLDAELLEMVSLDAGQVRQFLNSYGLTDLPRQIGPRLRDFLSTPFLLSALARIQAGLPDGGLPSSTGRLYEKLIDQYIFGSREQAKTGDSRPTRYHYERVKKPVLREIAAQMCIAGVTRRPEDRDLQVTIRDRLYEIRDEQEGLIPFVPYELMPDPPTAAELLEEVASNGIIRRADATVEFTHESFRDYFAAVKIVDCPLAEEIVRWPLADALRSAPRLIWRQVTTHFDEYWIGSSVTGLLAMIAGLRDDPEPFIRALAERNLVIAAYCHAEAPTPGAADFLASFLRPMLQHRHPARRWIACYCVGQAGLRSRDFVTSLLELVRSDTEWPVRDAAARALGRIGDHQAIRKLVTDALADIALPSPSGFGEHKTTRIVWSLNSEIAVLEVFDAWRSAAADSDRKARAQQLFAAVDPELVRKTLRAIGTEDGRIKGEGAVVHDAEEVLLQLSSWKGDGLFTADHARYLVKQAAERYSAGFQAKLTEWSAYSTAELLARLQDTDAGARAAAVTLLRQRHEPATADPFLEALATEVNRRVRDALLEALRPLASQPEFMNAWSSRLADPGWAQVATLAPALSAHLPSLGTERLGRDVPLDQDIRAALADQGVSIPEEIQVTAQPGYWDLTPRFRSSTRRYEDERTWLRILPAPGQLRVQDLGKGARLAIAGAVLGDRAVPVLRQALRTDPPSPLLREAVPEALAEIRSPGAVHELCTMLPISAERNQPVDHADSTLLEAIAGIRDPYAGEELLNTLRSLTPARRRHYEGSQWSSEASPESDLNSLNGPTDSLITALLAIGAQAQLAEFARDAFASHDDTLRHVATVTAARIDVIAPGLGGLLIEAVHATAAATRLVAVLALGRHETPSRRAALVHACLSEEDEMICDAAAAEIRGYQGDEGIHDLIAHLTQGEPAVRARAADALGRIWDELAVPPLVDALSSGLPRLQISAARALRRLEPSQVDRIIGPLVSIAATEPDAEIRSLAAKELERIPGGTGRLFAPAVEALDAGRYEDALHCLGETTPWIADSADLRRLRALALQGLQRLPEALDDIDAVLLQLPNWADALSFRAELLFTLDRPDEGLTAIREAARRRPDDADLQAVLGWWSYASGRFDESIHASRHAVELRPDHVGARLNLGLALLASGDTTLVERTYQQAVEQATSGDRAPGITLLTTALDDMSELERQAGVPETIASAVRSLLQAGVDKLNAVQRPDGFVH